MRAGALRYQGALQSRGTTQDSYGAPAVTWTTIATVPVALIPLSGRELLAAEAIKSEVNVEIHLRYRSDVTAQQRFVVDGANYNIHAVLDEDGRRRHLICLCSTGLNEGG